MYGAILLSLSCGFLTAQSSTAQAPVDHPADLLQGAAPEPAIPAILKAFQGFEVIAMPAAHGQKDTDDFILSLIRDPRFPASVNDIVVECGNMRYQSLLDQYIAGEDVPFTEVQHVWRDTTQHMCGASGFYEQLYPLVRSLNQHLPLAKRLRIVAADPPVDWTKIHSYVDLTPSFDRDENIASVMEREVLSKHRKALMLFGVFHLLHGGGPGLGDAVTRYELRYPGRTFVISDLGYFGASEQPSLAGAAPGGIWPSLLTTKGSRLGALSLSSFLPLPITIDEDCNFFNAFHSKTDRVVDQIDAFLYLGPQNSLLMEPLPADIALDRAYRSEWLRRVKLVGRPGPSTLEEIDAEIVADAADPILQLTSPKQSVLETMKSRMRQECLDGKRSPANKAP